MADIADRETYLPLGVVVERRISSHPWANWIWKPVAVFTNAQLDADWNTMLVEEHAVRFHAATLDMVLHRKETEAYIENLQLNEPVIYVVLQESENADPEFPWAVHHISASPFEAQDFEDTGDDIVEKVPMPDEVAAFVQAFVEYHHVEQKFIKRKRDKLKIEDQKFGKTPIFVHPTKH